MYHYCTASLRDVDLMLFCCWASVADIPSTIPSKRKTLTPVLLQCLVFFCGRADYCPPSFFSSHLAFDGDITGASSFWTRPLRPTQFSLGEIGVKLYRFWDRPYSWQKNGKVIIEAGPKPGKLHLQAAASPCSEWRPRWEIIIGRAQATGFLYFRQFAGSVIPFDLGLQAGH